jgi:hypothetical protein
MTLRISIKHNTQNINKKHATKHNYNNIIFMHDIHHIGAHYNDTSKYAEWHMCWAKLFFIVMLSVLLLSNVMLCVIMLIVIKPSIVALYLYFIKN